MLSVNQITKSFGVTPLLENISFTVNPGERWGLVGVNGCGKSTLLRILAGKEQADSGSFTFSPSTLRLGYLPQGLTLPEDLTLDECINSKTRTIESLGEELAILAQKLTLQPDESILQEKYDEVLAQLTLISQQEENLPTTLANLGLDHLPVDTPIAHLSGGQKTRLMLASVLLQDPQILLLDEPTNHLDLEMLTWLEDWVLNFRGGILMVSHDRTFLNRTVTGILDLDEHSHHVCAYPGSYDDYLQQRINEREQQLHAFKDQQEDIHRLRVSAREVRSRAKFHKGGKADPTRTDGFAVGFFSDRGKEVVQKAKNLEKRIEKMLHEDKIERPQRSWQMHVDFDKPEIRSREVLAMDDLTVGYPGLSLIEKINLTVQYGQHITLSGANGCGKTTLIKTITSQIPPLSGSFRLGGSIQVGLMSQEQSELQPELNALQSLQKFGSGNETELRRFLSLYLFNGDEVFVPVANMSYGERSRLALACLVAAGCNFLLLDEPINHLDIPSRTNFEAALQQFDGSVLAVVHDRYFTAGFAHQVWEVRERQIRVQNVSRG